MDISEFSTQDVDKLQDLINYHSDLYYNKDEPIISDFEYDELFKKLNILENKYQITKKTSENVGSEILESTFQKVAHSRPMISLDNTYNEEDLKDFDDRVKKNIAINLVNYLDQPHPNPLLRGEGTKGIIIEYVLEFKFDGLGVELIYKNGELVQAITRGNGIEGEDVTVNVEQIANIPKKIAFKDQLEVRGEVVMPISVFHELNETAKKEGTKIFSNPRNAASGSLRMKDANVTKKRKLQFFAYDLANFDEFVTGSLAPLLRGKGDNVEYYKVILELQKLGFSISSYFKKLNGINEVIEAIENFGNVKKTIDFEIDGLVLKVNDISLWESIGWTEHHPKYAIAYKFPAEILTTKVLSVEHSVGRTGTITPVANLEPINIGGVIVKRATLHNYEEVENLDVRIGDTVFIKRAGEVIPKIISVVKEGDRDDFEKIVPPTYCPSCKTLVKKDDEKVRFYCPNDIDCPAKHSEKLTFAVGKQGFNIDGFGEKQVELFLQEGIIHNLVDIFKISEKREEILTLEGFKEKSVNNLIEAVDNAKNLSINTLLTALGIAGVGKKTAKTISKLITSPLAPLLRGEGNIEELEELEDVGPEIAKNVIEYFQNDSHKLLLNELIEILNIEYYKEKVVENDSILNGKKVCITGSFEGYSREQLVEKLESVGGTFVTSVSKNTDYLLAGEKAGSKLKKANELGVELLDLEGFLHLIY